MEETSQESGFDRLRNKILSAVPEDIRDSIQKSIEESRSPEAQAQFYESVKRDKESAYRRKNYQLALERSHMTGDMVSDTLDKYDPTHRLQYAALKAANGFVKEWPDVEKRGIMFYGKPGIGKSHLLRGIGLELMKRYPSPHVIYFYAPEIERTLRKEEKLRKMYEGTGKLVPDSEEEIKKCDLLLLDDISKLGPNTSQGWLLNLVGCLIDQAERTGSPIICSTSNDDTESLKEIFGGAFVDRLQALMHWMEVDAGQSHRAEMEVPHWAR